MSDLALKMNSDLRYDLDFNGFDLALSDSLQGAVALSLGCFVRGGGVGVAQLGPQIGGWFGNSLNEVPMGSEMYRLFSGKVPGAAKEAKKIAERALQWLIDDGVAKSIDVSAETGENRVDLGVRVVKPDGTDDTFVYQVNWEASV